MAMLSVVVETERVPRLGPYSQTVRAGDLLFTSGQPGVDPVTGAPAGDTFEGQARQAFANLASILEDGGSALNRVVKVTCYVTDAAYFPELNQLFAEVFPDGPPVRSTPVVQLPRGLLISVDAVALVD